MTLHNYQTETLKLGHSSVKNALHLDFSPAAAAAALAAFFFATSFISSSSPPIRSSNLSA